jgi:hypothetical protein
MPSHKVLQSVANRLVGSFVGLLNAADAADAPRTPSVTGEAQRVLTPNGFATRCEWRLSEKEESCAFTGVLALVVTLLHDANSVH